MLVQEKPEICRGMAVTGLGQEHLRSPSVFMKSFIFNNFATKNATKKQKDRKIQSFCSRGTNMM
jgi:meiotically up-regulated gene 157 (Mug157) protein